MSALKVVSGAIEDGRRREAIYGGDLLVFAKEPPMVELCAYADALILDPASELRPVIEPGDLLCFSGAHLHASVPNTTGVARFSAAGRTADAGDAAAGRGA